MFGTAGLTRIFINSSPPWAIVFAGIHVSWIITWENIVKQKWWKTVNRFWFGFVFRMFKRFQHWLMLFKPKRSNHPWHQYWTRIVHKIFEQILGYRNDGWNTLKPSADPRCNRTRRPSCLGRPCNTCRPFLVKYVWLNSVKSRIVVVWIQFFLEKKLGPDHVWTGFCT